MKKIAIASLIAVLCISCTQNELKYFDESYSALNIWFGSPSVISDSLTFNYAYTVLERDSVNFYARLCGMPAPVDRTFRLKAVEGDVDLVDFVIQDYVLPAGEVEGTYPLFINVPDDFSQFTDRSGHIVFELEENEHFLPGANESSHLCLVLKNFLSKPDEWDSAMYPYMPLSRYFGTYSDVKYAFIIQVTGYSNFRVYYTMGTVELPEGEITATVASYLGMKCKLALEEYNSSHDTPLTDEFGFQVSFP